MTSRERIMRVLNREMPDRMPICPRMWAYLFELYGRWPGIDEYRDFKRNVHEFDLYTDTSVGPPNFIYSQEHDHAVLPGVEAALTETQDGGKKFVRRTIKTPKGPLTDFMVYPPAGAEYGIAPNPEKLEPLVKTADDLDRVAYLLPDPRAFPLPDLRAMDDRIGDDGCLMIRPHAGVDHLLLDALGFEGAMVLYYEDRALFDALLTLFHEHYKEHLVHCLESGAKIIFEGWYNCSLSTGWSPDTYRECFLPRIKEDIAITHGFGAFFHFYDDGKIMPVAKDLADSGADVISTVCPPPMGDVDARELKAIVKGKAALNGYVDLVNIQRGTPAEVEAQTKFAMDVLGDGGGYLLGTNDSIRNGSPKENVAAFLNAGLRYGRY